MQYLTYEEYKEIGGLYDTTAFNRNIVRACGIIDQATFKRIEKMQEVPQQAKELCRDLVDYLVDNFNVSGQVSSVSQSVGGVSESKGFVVRSVEEKANDINDMIKDYLLLVNNDKGTPLLYRGVN